MKPRASWRGWAIAASPDPKRRLLLDRGAEARGVLLVGGKPRQLLLDRPESAEAWLAGETLTARVGRLDRGLGMAFLDAGPKAPELTAPILSLVEGARIAAVVTAPAREGKLASARVTGVSPGEGEGRSFPRPGVEQRLAALAGGGAVVETGPFARAAADAAQDEALQVEHALPGGARLFIEPTRAMICVDVDVAASAAGGDARRRQKQANLAALTELPRLLRLKGLGGLVAVDLVGKGHDGETLAAAAKAAFVPVFGAEIAFGPVSRFGVLQLQLPWLDRPVRELLLDDRGEPTPLTRAFALLREVENAAGPGGRVQAFCAPAVASAAAPHAEWLKARIGDRFSLVADAAVAAEAPILRVS